MAIIPGTGSHPIGVAHTPDGKFTYVNDVSSAGTWETIVVDLATRKVKARIPSPNGGDTHSGGFVRYNPDFTGEVLADMGGPQKAMYETRWDKAGKLAAVKP